MVESVLEHWFRFNVSGRDHHGVADDVAIIHAVAAGDPDALQELYRVYSSELFVFILRRLGDRQLAEETLQDVMLAAWRGARGFRAESSVRTWLYSIAHKRALSARRKLPANHTEFEPELLESGATGPEELVDLRRRAAAVHAAVSGLPQHQRLVIELIYLHGLTGPEVARVLGVAVGTVKSRHNRALTALKPLLEELADAS